MTLPLSILDLAPIRPGETPGESFAASVAMAQLAERLGYRRIWYAEHHNIPSIASSATAVVIAHVGAFTKTIRLGAGGIMLPNHAPLMVAEQFGTLEAMYPGRIDLGLGRAPGADQDTAFALRRYPTAVDRFPDDVLELQGFLSSESPLAGIEATPGKGSHVPLYILGSSLFGAQLAAGLGLPYAFASHFAPDDLLDAVALYRREFRPSRQLEVPYVIAGVNALAADSPEEAQRQLAITKRIRLAAIVGRGRPIGDADADALLDSPAGRRVEHM
ncbi:MAG: LLM class flavin-dependent oxidoreductase, partial [Actinomycetota bacterium]